METNYHIGVEEYHFGMFIEVGGQIRKKSLVPLGDGEYVENYIPWTYESIRRAYGKEKATEIGKEMPRYDGEIIEPQNVDYHPVIGRYINAYHPLKYQPSTNGGEWKHIEALLRHIFGEQYNLGLDYMKLLYEFPKQKTPVLLLVSSEQGSGKSTFCNFLKEIFGDNATELTNDNLRSQFTSTWMSKNVVYIEETLLDKREDSEKIKNIVTALKGQSEAKGKDRVEIPLYSHFLMCSNDEERPVSLLPEDTRFWVRKIHTITDRRPCENFFEELRKEIPNFLYELLHRDFTTQNEDRLWFRRDLIVTDAWKKIVYNSRNLLERQLVETLLEIMADNEVDTLRYTLNDLIVILKRDGRVERTTLKRIVHRWGLKSTATTERYQRIMPSEYDGWISASTTGHPYEFLKSMLKGIDNYNEP